MGTILASLLVFGMIFLGFFPIMFAVKKANQHSKEDVLSAEDFKNNKENYMNIINKISPAALAYVDKMKFDYWQAVTAILLQLKMKEVVKYEKHGLVKLKELTDLEEPEFGKIEKYIFESIKDGQVFASKKELEELVAEEAKKENLIEDNKNEKFFRRVEIMLIILIVLYIASKILVRIEATFNIGWFLGIAGKVLCIAFFIYFIMYDGGKYQRTEYGVETNKKIEGLKNYIKEYSLLHEKNSDAIKIWDDYFIYYAIFDEKSTEIIDHVKYIRMK